MWTFSRNFFKWNDLNPWLKASISSGFLFYDLPPASRVCHETNKLKFDAKWREISFDMLWGCSHTICFLLLGGVVKLSHIFVPSSKFNFPKPSDVVLKAKITIKWRHSTETQSNVTLHPCHPFQQPLSGLIYSKRFFRLLWSFQHRNRSFRLSNYKQTSWNKAPALCATCQVIFCPSSLIFVFLDFKKPTQQRINLHEASISGVDALE